METTDKNMTIFDTVTALVAEDDFNQAQTEFVKKNHAIFDEEEENKHEYKQVYEDYVNIMERMIEAKLKETYSEDEIEAFL